MIVKCWKSEKYAINALIRVQRSKSRFFWVCRRRTKYLLYTRTRLLLCWIVHIERILTIYFSIINSVSLSFHLFFFVFSQLFLSTNTHFLTRQEAQLSTVEQNVLAGRVTVQAFQKTWRIIFHGDKLFNIKIPIPYSILHIIVSLPLCNLCELCEHSWLGWFIFRSKCDSY